ncbi:hypothetical protein HPSD74_1077 [Glaesserella parasuis D74]|nr:hypothetical protein HPSSW114_0738 [Glaesserella parasuis SW114]EQA09870.1 hypothetical protein HPSD74_1077 [Glaesserella parasuis D74]EQA13321.1 hypothetical protein HPSSW140_0914 [Glaesserella parasuis SW140]
MKNLLLILPLIFSLVGNPLKSKGLREKNLQKSIFYCFFI